MGMQRIMVFDRTDAYRFDIDPLQVLDATTKEEVNGEHSLTLTTLQELEKTDRLLMLDGMGRWHEYVVLGIEEKHTAGGAVQHEYYCVWSLQYDLSATFINNQFGCGVVPGHASIPQPARRGLECALEGTSRWVIGTITVTAQASASFYRRSGWEGLQTVVERWGGSLAATITVSTTGVVGRAVDLLAHEGTEVPTRRFDYGADVTGIKRTVSDDVWPCRIVPLGKSMETEEGGYTRRPSIESVNGGVMWLEDADAVPLVRIPNGSGGWEYPTAIVKNDTYEQPADLLAWATEHIGDYTRPIVTYEADVAQFERAGLSAHGVALGDEVVVVDRTFGSAGLRITARVMRIEASLLDPAQQKLTIGNAKSTLAGQLSELATSIAALAGEVASASEWRTSSSYMDAIIGRLNDEINATGGYWYIVPGYGTRTYDVPVSDPAVGAEASSVVEVRGGTIRIANSRTQAGDWEWKTVFTSGHIAAEVITALNVSAGLISSYDGSSYWDLDTGVFERGLLWEPIATWSSFTTNADANVYYSEQSFTPTTGKRYLIFFTTAEEIQGDMTASLASYPPFHQTVPRMRLVSSESGAYRYVSITTYDIAPARAENAFFRTTKETGSGTSYPVYHVTDVRVYEWPSEGDGTIGFDIHSEDGVDSMRMTLTGGGLQMSIGNDQTAVMPGRIDMAPDDISGAASKIDYDPLSKAMSYSGKIVADDELARFRGHMITAGTNADWLMATTTQNEVFERTTTSGVSLALVRSWRWGPLVCVHVEGTLSKSLTFTNGSCINVTNLASFNSPFTPVNVTGSIDTASSFEAFGTYRSSAGEGMAQFTLYNGLLRLRKMVMDSPASGTVTVSSVTFRLNAIYFAAACIEA